MPAATLGKACQKAAIPELIEPRSRIAGTGSQQYLVRPARYGDRAFAAELKAAEARLAANPTASAADIEAMARAARPDDFYLK
ncbi:hypothetical protein J8J40_30825, partial [Mycobacterium tuberculosis]|nr:hypothetical protein [Mycobacterium tuberculosis]